jgi:hypothetical protein
MSGVQKESKGDVLVMTCVWSRELQIERGRSCQRGGRNVSEIGR